METRQSTYREFPIGSPAASAPRAGNSETNTVSLDALEDDESTPEEAALLAEEVENLLGRLGDPALRQIAVWKLEGHTNVEIARKQGCSLPAVERRPGIILRLLKDG